MSWRARSVQRLRALDAMVVDGAIAAVLFVLGVTTVYGQDIREAGAVREGFREPSALLVLTVLWVCAPVAVRRRVPLPALACSAIGTLVHFLIGWPEGALPLAPMLLTYSVGAWCSLRPAVSGLAIVSTTIVVLSIHGSPGLDGVGAVGVIAQFAAAWAIGVALRNRRAVTDARVRGADERAETERQRAARAIAEERLRIAQELHDVVAHSMSVIAVQAGVGAHVLEHRPDQARAALEAISATSRGTLTELRRLLGVLRDEDGERAQRPAPTLADLPQLVDDVRSAGVPVSLHVEGAPDRLHPGVELSAYRVVQEALTNVIKHAGRPRRVDVVVRCTPETLHLEVTDDGRGLAASPGDGEDDETGHHGLVGMRERVELWGGEMSAGPAPGGGYRVRASLPYGEAG